MLSTNRGSVIVELALVLPILLLLLAGTVDYYFIRREHLILSEAARASLRVVLTAPTFAFNSYSGVPIDTQKENYVRERYQRAIFLARYLAAAGGLNADNYYYNIFDVERTDPAGGDPYHTVQLNLSSRAVASRMFVFPGGGFKACVGASGIIAGVVLRTAFSLSDPEPDPDCQPQES
jgi:hypothetical protein